MKINIIITSLFIVIFNSSIAQGRNDIVIPTFNDKYSALVKQLESGNINIDYKEFRDSFLDSKQFQIKSEKRSKYDSLEKEMFVQAGKSNYLAIIISAKAMLSIDYSSLYAHKYLQQTYKIMGDTANRNKYHSIEFGLLHSITDDGDGKACETAWEVIQIEEEYFLLDMIGVELQKQSLTHSGNNICDRMDVKTEDGKSDTYYFGVRRIFAKYPKQ